MSGEYSGDKGHLLRDAIQNNLMASRTWPKRKACWSLMAGSQTEIVDDAHPQCSGANTCNLDSKLPVTPVTLQTSLGGCEGSYLTVSCLSLVKANKAGKCDVHNTSLFEAKCRLSV